MYLDLDKGGVLRNELFDPDRGFALIEESGLGVSILPISVFEGDEQAMFAAEIMVGLFSEFGIGAAIRPEPSSDTSNYADDIIVTRGE